ncbi:MAG: glycosyltransferase [Synechococcaceae cyanobacterium]|nr:glycosyltransferase [Synechococcaceae cyanobacterium]
MDPLSTPDRAQSAAAAPGPDRITLAFVSSAYNEAANLRELHQRCRLAHAQLQQRHAGQLQIAFRFVVADNCSQDDSLAVLQQIGSLDSEAILLANQANYGPEASVINALRQVSDAELIVLLCSDLQDPPELAVDMGDRLLQDEGLDAVLAIKQRSSGGPLLRLCRRLYYMILGYSSRFEAVPHGFHGFGCYRREVIQDTLSYLDSTDLNLRQCLINASRSPQLLPYAQADRQRGRSSYRGGGYWIEALRSLLSGDAAASRLALLIGGLGLLLAVLLSSLLLVNFLTGNSQYGGGIPTVMGLILSSFAIQMLMFAVLSRQIEALRSGGVRPRVRFRRLTPKATPQQKTSRRSREV